MSDQSDDPLMTQITDAIENIKRNITKYTGAAQEFTGYVGDQTKQLEELIKSLRKCLDKLVELKNSYASLIVKITTLEAQIATLTQITGDAATSAATEACNEKLTQILTLINDFAGTIGEFKGDAGALKVQVDELEKAIDEICDEADKLVAQQGDAETATTNLETALGGEKSDVVGDETKEEGRGGEASMERRERLPTPTGQGRNMSGTPVRETEREKIRRERKERDARIAARSGRMHDRTRERGGSDRFGPGSIYSQGATRGGWQTPDKLQSLSKSKPIRTLKSFKKKKKKKKKKKTRRKKKKRGRKRSRRR